MNELFFVDGLHLYSYDYTTNRTYKYVNPPEDFTPNPTPSIEGVHNIKMIKVFNNGIEDGADHYEKWYEPCQYELEDGYKGSNNVPTALDLIEIKGDRLYVHSTLQGMENLVFISYILNPSYFPYSSAKDINFRMRWFKQLLLSPKYSASSLSDIVGLFNRARASVRNSSLKSLKSFFSCIF